MARLIGSVGGDQLIVGGRLYTDLANLKKLITRVDGGGQYSSFKTATTSYQVPSGKTLNADCLRVQARNTTGGLGSLLYGSTNAGISNASPPSGVVTYGTDNMIASESNANTVLGYVTFDIYFPIPQNMYPHIQSGTSMAISAYLYGYEV